MVICQQHPGRHGCPSFLKPRSFSWSGQVATRHISGSPGKISEVARDLYRFRARWAATSVDAALCDGECRRDMMWPWMKETSTRSGPNRRLWTTHVHDANEAISTR